MTPTYDFQCPNCSTKTEVRRSVNDDSPAPTCGDCLVVMEKVFSPTPAIFRGSGWAKVPRP